MSHHRAAADAASSGSFPFVKDAPARALALTGVLLIAPLVLLLLHGLAIVPMAWSERELRHLEPGAGRQYVESLGTTWMSRHQVGESPAVVLEDGVPLPCANMPPEAIAEFGAGRYMLADSNVYLSAPDNADPRTNGRRYLLRWPTPPSLLGSITAAYLLATIAAVAGLVMLAWSWRERLVATIAHPPFALSAAMFVVPFVLHRAWFLFDVPLPGLQNDTSSYYAPALDLLSGRWPHLEVRPPGYPMFLASIFAAGGGLVGVTVAQTLLTAAACLVLIFGVHRLRPAASPWAAIAMAAWATGFWPLQHDTSILSESVYASTIIFAIGFLIWSLAGGGAAIFALASIAIALAIATRPAGLFLLVLFVLIAVYLRHTRRTRAEIMAFVVPFPALMLALALYNWSVSGVFTITAWGEANLSVSTFTFWEPSPDYPPEINERIAAIVAKIGITEAENRARAETWSPSRLTPIFLKGYNGEALDLALGIAGGYGNARPWLRRISSDAIRKHPNLYVKFVSSMAYMYYLDNIRWRADFVDYVNARAMMLLTREGLAEQDRAPLRHDLIARHFNPSAPVRMAAADQCSTGGAGAVIPTAWRRLYRATQRTRDQIFSRTLFAGLAAMAFVLAAWQFARSGGRHDVAFVTLILGLGVIGSGLVVCLVEYAGHRYSYPTEGLVYLAVALAPWLRSVRA